MRTPKGSVKAYDGEGNFIGYVFKDWRDKISYEVRKKDREDRKKHKEKMMKMIMNGEIKDAIK
tara:strand:+ start:193 stop:381 length:189 start_codon:yes stop_codon:yes gene_type:complete